MTSGQILTLKVFPAWMRFGRTASPLVRISILQQLCTLQDDYFGTRSVEEMFFSSEDGGFSSSANVENALASLSDDDFVNVGV